MYKISIHKVKRVFYVISMRGPGVTQNTIGLANPTKWGERKDDGFAVASREAASRETRASSNLPPLYPFRFEDALASSL